MVKFPRNAREPQCQKGFWHFCHPTTWAFWRKNGSSVVSGSAVGTVEGREYELHEVDEKSPNGLNRYPPPIGYGGYNLDEVAWAEQWNDRMGVADPIYRKLNCWMWLASSYLAEGNREMAIRARDEYHKLRHEDETITEECGLCKAHEISPLDSLEGL